MDCFLEYEYYDIRSVSSPLTSLNETEPFVSKFFLKMVTV